MDVHIKSLRKKLGDAGELIETVRGVGYRFHDSRLVRA
jgi:DNA-binding response OmpR family regulator